MGGIPIALKGNIDLSQEPTTNSRPLGLHLIGPPLDDGQLLAIVQAIQPLLPQLTMPELEE